MARHSLQSPTRAHVIDDTEPRYRSGVAARIARMPVATLRTWERRFQVVAPHASLGGHRLYSASDVQRLTLLKQLSDMGHSIGHMAPLSIEQLREVATTHATLQAPAVVRGGRAAPAVARPLRIVVVGQGLLGRLRRRAVQRGLGRAMEITGPFVNIAQCLESAPRARPDAGEPPTGFSPSMGRPDLLLVELPSMQEQQAPELQRLARAWGVAQAAVVCLYATRSACDAARLAGYDVRRGPIGEDALADWLRWLSNAPAARSDPPADAPPAPCVAPAPVPERRFDDGTLADMAALSATMACECPRHVSELLVQLSAFEAYSAQCVSLSSADAELHRCLQHSAASARAILEVALERIALHEGLVLKA